MSTRPKKSAVCPGDAPQERVHRLAQMHGADPERLLAWALRADGRMVVITADGRKLIEAK